MPDAYGVLHLPPAKKGVTYARMKPKLFKRIQVIAIRFSHDRDSSTVLPLLLKFISNKAMDAVTTAAIVEISRIWFYTSFIISSAFCQMVVAAKASCVKQAVIHTARNATYRMRPLLICRRGLAGLGTGVFFKSSSSLKNKVSRPQSGRPAVRNPKKGNKKTPFRKWCFYCLCRLLIYFSAYSFYHRGIYTSIAKPCQCSAGYLPFSFSGKKCSKRFKLSLEE